MKIFLPAAQGHGQMEAKKYYWRIPLTSVHTTLTKFPNANFFYQGLDGSGADRDEEIQDPHPVLKLKRKEGRRPAILLGLRDGDNDTGVIKVYARRLTRPGTYVLSFYLVACAF